MQTATDNLMQIASELNAAGKQVKVTVLKPRKARRSELIMSSTKGVRTNTNRRGQAYTGHATYATQSTVEGNRSAYFKTSGWITYNTLQLQSSKCCHRAQLSLECSNGLGFYGGVYVSAKRVSKNANFPNLQRTKNALVIYFHLKNFCPMKTLARIVLDSMLNYTSASLRPKTSKIGRRSNYDPSEYRIPNNGGL